MLSGYGTHLVYVHHVIEPPAQMLAKACERVTQDWTTDKGEELNEQFYTNLRDQYTIVVETPVAAADEGAQAGSVRTIGEQVADLSEASQ